MKTWWIPRFSDGSLSVLQEPINSDCFAVDAPTRELAVEIFLKWRKRASEKDQRIGDLTKKVPVWINEMMLAHVGFGGRL